jgi:hypothetical protein
MRSRRTSDLTLDEAKAAFRAAWDAQERAYSVL